MYQVCTPTWARSWYIVYLFFFWVMSNIGTSLLSENFSAWQESVPIGKITAKWRSCHITWVGSWSAVTVGPVSKFNEMQVGYVWNKVEQHWICLDISHCHHFSRTHHSNVLHSFHFKPRILSDLEVFKVRRKPDIRYVTHLHPWVLVCAGPLAPVSQDTQRQEYVKR